MNPEQQARLPQIDPVTFAALTALDAFLARAPLNRQEHAEAARCLQHVVQTVEALQSTLKSLTPAPFPANGGTHSHTPSNGHTSGADAIARH